MVDRRCSVRSSPTLLWLLALSLLLANWPQAAAFSVTPTPVAPGRRRAAASAATLHVLFADNWNKDMDNANPWTSSDDEGYPTDDWQDVLSQKQDGTFWSTFEPSLEGAEESSTDSSTEDASSSSSSVTLLNEEAEAELWMDALRSLTSEEVEFNLREAERADTARQMEEWGFTPEIIRNALDVAVDTSLETIGDVDERMQTYRQESFLDDVDLQTVESHTKVALEENGEPFRSQMVYVDEHTCIGCTNCAMIAQSTFFMHQEHGRARVFQQWGDDDETIQIAIETCPVDCIHYVPFDELVSLEKERRGQNINFKARLVSQAENAMMRGGIGGSSGFTGPQRISGDTKARCTNCPTRGCKDCPMYGVGKNPEFERKEKARLLRMAKKKLREQNTAEL